jgi:hypothetical protein
MISDVLSEMVADIDRYLGDSVFDRMYQGKVRARVIALRNEANALRIELDAPPFPMFVADPRSAG